jgi:hypothetical protein
MCKTVIGRRIGQQGKQVAENTKRERERGFFVKKSNKTKIILFI